MLRASGRGAELLALPFQTPDGLALSVSTPDSHRRCSGKQASPAKVSLRIPDPAPSHGENSAERGRDLLESHSRGGDRGEKGMPTPPPLSRLILAWLPL